MKKIIITSLVLFTIAGTAFGATVIKKIDVTYKENKATVYVGNGEINIYEVKLASGICYVSYLNTQSGTLRAIEHELSCIK